jgi:excisionase family DNA binding protein
MKTSNPKMNPATPDLLKQRLMLRAKEYGELTGTPLPTVYAYIAAGKIPGVIRIGNSLRIPVAAVLEQLKAGSPAA